MADSNVTESKTTDNAVANDEATTPAAAVPSPAAMKAHAPSPAVLAKSPVAHLRIDDTLLHHAFSGEPFWET